MGLHAGRSGLRGQSERSTQAWWRRKRGSEARSSSLRVCENIPAKSRHSNNWELLQRPVHSRRPPHIPLRVVTVSGSLGSARLGSAWEAPREKLCLRQEKERKSSSDKESQPLTMKPVFVLLVSTAWTLTGAQYYYQGLMDYLENRLLAIEVRKNNSHQ